MYIKNYSHVIVLMPIIYITEYNILSASPYIIFHYHLVTSEKIDLGIYTLYLISSNVEEQSGAGIA